MRYQLERQGFRKDAPIAVVDMYKHWGGSGHLPIKLFGQDIKAAQEYADVLNTCDENKAPDLKYERYVEEAYSDYFRGK